MSAVPRAETVSEVEDYLKRNRDVYLEFLRDLSVELDRMKNSPECSRLIYRIYSRADKQLGDPLKKPWKIAEKLDEWRKAGPCAVHLIHDIIGFTIVVNFPSDRQLLAIGCKG